MKKLLTTIIVFLGVQQALACDAYLQKFARDCQMQDRLVKIREAYTKIGVDVDEIGEYKVLRFIDRDSWEKAKTKKITPLEIYSPAPATWRVWEHGIDSLFKGKNNKDALFGQVSLDQNTFSHINTVLLTDGRTSIKGKETDQRKRPGEFRANGDKNVGFCTAYENASKYRQGIQRSEDSMDRFKKRWESLLGVEFSEVVKKENGPNPLDANLKSEMSISTSLGCGREYSFVTYSTSNKVTNQIEWLRIFIKANLEAYQRGEPVLAPVELAAVVQKWFVSVHPFADGNGRTSRGVQELIMANFGLPFIPAGDLQNDALEEVEKYVENTYNKIDATLTVLESCIQGRDSYTNYVYNRKTPRACRTIEELNSGKEPTSAYNN